jgi:thioredoxin reductase (NADPH)
MDLSVDCLTIGGGPAGLTAAIYGARFRLNVLVIDSGGGRAALIPCTRNHAGFPDGISGAALLSRMRRQARKFGARFGRGTIDRVASVPGGFLAAGEAGEIRARAVLLATGVTNHSPPMATAIHRAALAAGRLRYCPVCDGLEVLDERVAVIGRGDHGVKEALFVRAYTRQVTLVLVEPRQSLPPDELGALTAAGIEILHGPATDFELYDEGIEFSHAEGRTRFEAVYAALGSSPHSELARGLGAEMTEEGCIKVDAHQRTTIRGLYAAGDVVAGLDQISHAMGQAAVAATAIRNDLAALHPLWR